MKILKSAQIRELDKYTIENEPVTSIELMERAARQLTDAITSMWDRSVEVVVFAGPGNNGGDALAVARMLGDRGYDVKAVLFNINGRLSSDCEKNRDRLVAKKHVKSFVEVKQEFDPPKLTRETLVVDGLFGSGLNKPLAGGFASVVQYINMSEAQVVSIDIPSGMMTECNTYNVQNNIVKANVTLTLGSRKLCMMFADMQPMLGEVKVLDIGLSEEFMRKVAVQYEIVEEQMVADLLQSRSPFAHKGTMGHALLIAGSNGMAGAAILAARSCLRSGPGKLTVVTPKCNQVIMQLGVPEAILSIDKDDECFTRYVDTEIYDSIGIGPGLGDSKCTADAVVSQVCYATAPMVLDADGINAIARSRISISNLPDGTVLTPHPKEMSALANMDFSDDYEMMGKASEMAQNINGYVLLKGHYTALCLPDGNVMFNSTGNAGMATAGSGDVLTGIITGLMARGYDSRTASLIGMYVHGLAGDIAAEKVGEESLVASDIVECLPLAFKRLYSRKD